MPEGRSQQTVLSELALTSTSLTNDWTILLGSAFGDHAVGGKSKREPHDIRKLLIALNAKKARIYPKGDLTPARKRWRRGSEPNADRE